MVHTRLSVKKIALKRKAEESKDPNKPKRPATPFFVFMETFRKRFEDENPTIKSVVAIGKAGGAKWKSMSESEKAPFVVESEQRKTAGSSSVESVMSNDDLLIQILIRLPILSLVLFKSVSKRWLSLLNDAINVTFCRNPDPPSGLFLEKISFKRFSEQSYSCDFVPLDNRIPLLGTNFTFGPDEDGDFEMLDSCNGLLLCRRTYSVKSLDAYNCTYSEKLYVCNPSITNMLKVLPQLDIETYYEKHAFGGGLKIAFDPTKSPHYKVIYAEIVAREIADDMEDDMVDVDDMYMVQLHTFSSKTGNWSLCEHQFPEPSFEYFADGVYWNDAIYWPIGDQDKIVKLDVMNEHPVLTALPTPLIFDLKVNYGYRLFKSRGCLLLYGMDNASSQHFTIYEKRNVDSEWSVKYIVNLEDIIKSFPKSPNVSCIVLGEREEDSYLVIKQDKKVVQYKIVSKTLTTISCFDLGPNDVDLVRCFQFIPSFANV